MPIHPRSTSVFRTKSGTCEIGKDLIVLRRHGIRGALASVVAELFAGFGRNRPDDKIPLAQVKRVEGTPAIPSVSRAFFRVHYLRDGQLQQRLIILPGILGGGAQEYEHAIDVFANSGIQVNAG